MAGPIQSAISSALNVAGATAIGAKKLSEDAKQAEQKASAKAEAERKAGEEKALAEKKALEEKELAQKQKQEATLKEAKGVALEADLIRMGADPESARAFMTARELGLSTKQFMLREKGRFSKAYSTIAEQASKDALTNSLSSKVLNKQGFAERVVALGGTRKERVRSLVEASKGGKK